MPADTETLKRAEHFLQKEGPFERGRLILSVNPARVDWVYKAVNDPPLAEDLSSIGSLEESASAFLGLLRPWTKACPKTQRLALGAELIEPMATIEEAYGRLAEYLRTIQIDPRNSSDFLYRINRARDSTQIPGLKINRLSTWSALQIKLASFELPAGRPQLTQLALSSIGKPACRMELDINTAADYGELPDDKIGDLFTELVELSKEIAKNGDVP